MDSNHPPLNSDEWCNWRHDPAVSDKARDFLDRLAELANEMHAEFARQKELPPRERDLHFGATMCALLTVLGVAAAGDWKVLLYGELVLLGPALPMLAIPRSQMPN